MKSTGTQTRADKTREAICRALADVISSSADGEFSVQEVADRAEVTHRTVYNHFPNRQALIDGLNDYMEDLGRGGAFGFETPEDVDAALTADTLPDRVPNLYRWSAHDEALSRAVAMVSLTVPRLNGATRDRTAQLEAAFADDVPEASADQLHLLAAAVRVFASHTGWHLLTGPHGLTQDEAERAATWATRVLIDAVRSGDGPKPTDSRDPAEGPDD